MPTGRPGTKHESDNFCENQAISLDKGVNAPLGTILRFPPVFEWCSVKTGRLNPVATETKVKTRMVYFIQSDRFVKIGFCERDPIRRLEKLQVGNPVPLKLLALIDGSRIDESNWHMRFDKQRVRGEWFQLNRTLLTALRPHLVDHDEVSRRRPERTICGRPAYLMYAAINAAVDLETPASFEEQGARH